MTSTLRDALQAARINRLKTSMARAWRERQNAEFPVCQGCGARHAPLVDVLRALGGQDDEAQAVPPTTHLN